MMARIEYLGFVECAGCGEVFAVHNAHAMARAKWCSERCRKAQYKTPCARCGKPCGGSDKSLHCLTCGAEVALEMIRARRAERDKRVALVIRLRGEGLSNGEIAARLGTSRPAVTNLLSRARKRGLDVPRSPYFARGRAA